MSVDPRIGTVVAGSRIEARCRPGGMSEVFRAEHLHLGRKVALKLLDPRLGQDEGYRQRFQRESRLAAALYHPNIVPIYDAGEADGTPYLMMHFVEGDDLADLIRREGPLPVDRVISIIGQVVKALDAAHDRGLVHRDVKPGNILIASGEGVEPSGHTYLTDFGLAKQVSSGTALTRKGLFMGTLDYVAPEQIQGLDVDRRADVYAMGAVTYESLAGEVPFPRDSEVAMMYAHMNDPPPSLAAKRPDLPPQVDPVIARAMAKDTSDRYATAGQFFSDLKDALAAEGVDPSAPAPAQMGAQPAAAGAAPMSPEEVAAAPDAAPVAPPLVDVFAIDFQGTRFGIGRTANGYAIWDMHAGGPPVRVYPLAAESWDAAWATYQELEASPDPTAEAAIGAPEPRPEEMSTSSPGEPLLMGVVFLDYRGQKYALGRTADSYGIWDLQAGGYPVQVFPLHDQGWLQGWSRYQELEASPAASPEGAPAVADADIPAEAVAEPQPQELAGALALDYQGGGYALGRTSDAYAIWDVTSGGHPVRVFSQDGGGWQEAWQAFQDLESGTG
jgi:serine/threonine-protein kinase